MPEAAVGALGAPVKVGLAISAASVIPYPAKVVGLLLKFVKEPLNKDE